MFSAEKFLSIQKKMGYTFLVMNIILYGIWLLLLFNGFIYHVNGTLWLFIAIIADIALFLIQNGIWGLGGPMLSTMKPSVTPNQ